MNEVLIRKAKEGDKDAETHFHTMSLLETVITSQFRTGIFQQ